MVKSLGPRTAKGPSKEALKLLKEREREARQEEKLQAKYAPLGDVLDRAFDQCARGKGSDRHAAGGFGLRDQFTAGVLPKFFGIGFPLGQACKKCQEVMASSRSKEDKVNELLGAINYIAYAVLELER